MPFQIPLRLLERLRMRRSEQREIRRGRAAVPDFGQPPIRNFIDLVRPLFAAEKSADYSADEYVAAMNVWQDEIEDQYDAFLLDPGMGPMTYLTADGRILHDMRGWDGDEIIEVTGFDAHAALVIGARKTGIPELLELIPPPPPGSSTCPRCHGKRLARIAPEFAHEFPCNDCEARGWIETK